MMHHRFQALNPPHRQPDWHEGTPLELPWSLEVLRYAVKNQRRRAVDIVDAMPSLTEQEANRVYKALTESRRILDFDLARRIGPIVNIRFYWGLKGPLIRFDREEALAFAIALRERLGWRRMLARAETTLERWEGLERSMNQHEHVHLMGRLRGVRYW